MKSFEQIVDEAIDFSEETRKLNEEHFNAIRQTMHPAAFAREFCTVHIDLGRQTGKTTYIQQHEALGDIIVTPTFAMKKYGLEDTLGECFTASQIKDERFLMQRRGKPAGRYVFVDEPELITRICPLDRIYLAFATGDLNQTFILLGH